MVTLAIILLTAGISIRAMNDPTLKNRFMFNAYAINHHKEWWRFFTGGVLHADYAHLMFNMLSLYFFGTVVEKQLCKPDFFGDGGGIFVYLLLYITAIPVSCFFTYFKQKDNKYYNALGASGAVSAIIFSSILIYPSMEISFFIIPIPLTGWLYGIIYLAASWFMARRNIGNIGHDAHFFGAVYGFLLPIAFKPDLWYEFIGHLRTSLMYTH